MTAEVATFPHDPRSVPSARLFVRETLSTWPRDVVEVIELMVSELATNCFLHAGTGFDLTVRAGDDTVRVEVTDNGSGQPHVLSPAPSEPSGRGLRIVETLSGSWGVTSHAGGKTVWFTVPAP
jgi:anti-sigma regulatory factor (Ser/Thr protein kinase)